MSDTEKRLESLDRFSSAVTLAGNLQDTLENLAGQIVEVSGAAGAVVVLLDEDLNISWMGRAKVPKAMTRAGAMLLKKRKDLPVLDAFRTGRPVVIGPEQRKKLLIGTMLGAVVDRTPFKFMACLPMQASGQTLGFINCFFPTDPREVVGEMAYLATLSRFTAVAVHNTRLVGKLEEEAVAEERRRLGRDLHDSVSQALYGIRLGAEAAREALDKEPGEALAMVDYIEKLAKSGLDEMRVVLLHLRPDTFEDEGLLGALRAWFKTMDIRSDTSVRTSLDREPSLDVKSKLSLYRFICEGSHNAFKHSGSKSLLVRLSHESENIRVEIVDKGSGFDVTRACSEGHGMKIMAERARWLGGDFQVQSAIGEGCTISLTLPQG